MKKSCFKKSISILISLLLTVNLFAFNIVLAATDDYHSVSSDILTDEEIEVKQIEYFAEKTVEVVNEYDEGKEFEAVSDDTASDDDLRFQTARLFVKCSSSFNKMGAEEKVSGFNSWHLLQYSSPEEAKKAYNYYLNQKKIEYVEPDLVQSAELNKQTDITTISKEEFYNDYSRQIMGFPDVLSYIKENNIETKPVKVAVLDTGIDYNHEIFKDRIFRTYFNSSANGIENDEYDIKTGYGHGTMVSSCIVANTPDSVTVGCYKVIDDKMMSDNSSSSMYLDSVLISALMKAYADGCQVINMSLNFSTTQLTNELLEELHNNNLAIFVSAGNMARRNYYGYRGRNIHVNRNVISVAASDFCNFPSNFSNSGIKVAFLASGTNVAVAKPDNAYGTESGTSFSSPLAVAEYALLLSLDKGFSRDKIIDLMSYTCTELPIDDVAYTKTWWGNMWYGAGVLDAIGAFCEIMNIERNSPVEFSINSGNCRSGDLLELTSPDGVDIYYTLDGSVPNKNNGIIYDKSILLDKYMNVNAVAIGSSDFKSKNTRKYYRCFTLGTDDMFLISDDGEILDYYGDVEYLEIPEQINGITVTSLRGDLFAWDVVSDGYDQIENDVIALKLPDTVTTLKEAYGDKFDYCSGICTMNENIEYFCANELFYLPEASFADCKNLRIVDLPKVKTIGDEAFVQTFKLNLLNVPNLEHIGISPLAQSSLSEFYAPKLKTYGGNLFYKNMLWDIDISELELLITDLSFLSESSNNFPLVFRLPKLKELTMASLNGIYTPIIEFSALEELYSLPCNTTFYGTNPYCAITVPHTLKNIQLKYIDKNSFLKCLEQNVYTFYGTKGCYAEIWANENGIPFVELNQDTAVVTDVREKCNKYTQTLFFDSLGFNKEYQWYGSFDNSTDNGIALEGATKELLNLKDYREYPYYYCVCTSKDIDESENFEHTELIYSKVCENIDYASADYSALNEAVALAPSDLSIYTTGSVEALQCVLDSIDYTLPISEQVTVDEYVQNILDAINNLEYKGADYSLVENAKAQIPADLSMYTDMSVAQLNAVLKSIDYDLNVVEQNVVDEQALAILDAINNLEYKSADYTEYNKAVEKANEIDRSLYKDLSALDEALSIDISNKNITEQDIVDSQTQEILNAIGKLELADILGDVNFDRSLTVVDARIILQSIVGIKNLNEKEKAVADVNGDGRITVIDAKLVLTLIISTE